MKKLTYEEYENIALGSDWEEIYQELTDQRRWYNIWKKTYKNNQTGELVILTEYIGNNESSEIEYSDYPAKLSNAEAYQETVTKYREVGEG